MIDLLIFLGGAVSLHNPRDGLAHRRDKQCSRTGDMKKWLARREFFSCASIRLRHLSCGTRRLPGLISICNCEDPR